MNLIEIHDKILSHLDQNVIGRIPLEMLDASFNAAHQAFLRKGFDIKESNGLVLVSPQAFQQVLEQQKFYSETQEIDPSGFSVDIKGGITPKVSRVLYNIEIKIGTAYKNPTPIPAKDRQSVLDNSHLVPTSIPFFVSYMYQVGDIFYFLVDESAVAIAKVRVSYLRVPDNMTHGINYLPGDLQTNNVSAIVNSQVAVYNGTTYRRGDIFTVVDYTLFTSGELLVGFTPVVDIDPQYIDEVCLEAAFHIEKVRIAGTAQ